MNVISITCAWLLVASALAPRAAAQPIAPERVYVVLPEDTREDVRVALQVELDAMGAEATFVGSPVSPPGVSLLEIVQSAEPLSPLEVRLSRPRWSTVAVARLDDPYDVQDARELAAVAAALFHSDPDARVDAAEPEPEPVGSATVTAATPSSETAPVHESPDTHSGETEDERGGDTIGLGVGYGFLRRSNGTTDTLQLELGVRLFGQSMLGASTVRIAYLVEPREWMAFLNLVTIGFRLGEGDWNWHPFVYASPLVTIGADAATLGASIDIGVETGFDGAVQLRASFVGDTSWRLSDGDRLTQYTGMLSATVAF